MPRNVTDSDSELEEVSDIAYEDSGPDQDSGAGPNQPQETQSKKAQDKPLVTKRSWVYNHAEKKRSKGQTSLRMRGGVKKRETV